MTNNSSENEILAKANISFKSNSSTTNVKFDLYYIKTISYTQFQVNIAKDRGENNFLQMAITQVKVCQM